MVANIGHRAVVAVLAASGFLGVLPDVQAQAPDPRYRLRLYHVAGSAQLIQTLDVSTVAGLPAPQALVGFTYGVCLGSGLQAVQLAPGAAIATLNGGHPPAFLATNLNPVNGPGFTLAVVVDFQSTYMIPPTLGLQLAVADLSITPGAHMVASYCGTLAIPQVAVVTVVAGGHSGTPTTFPVVVLQPPPPPPPPPPPVYGFVRGDCNGSGAVSVPDVVTLLLILFPPPGLSTTVPCEDACDANEDGSLSLADAILCLHALFGVPPAALPGPSVCGEEAPAGMGLACSGPPVCP